MTTFRYLLFSLFGFLLGSVLFSYHLPRLLKGVDIRALSEDHNPGAANAVKYAGIPVGMLCVFCDLFKGFLPVFLALRYTDPRSLWFALVLASPPWVTPAPRCTMDAAARLLPSRSARCWASFP